MGKIKGFLSRCCLNRDLNEDTEGDMETSEKKRKIQAEGASHTKGLGGFLLARQDRTVTMSIIHTNITLSGDSEPDTVVRL